MNYQQNYNNLIIKARNRLLCNVYIEKHHIIPRSMGGSNLSGNIVNLTAKEHYVAHHLLWKIYKNQSMTYAFWNMCNTRNNSDTITARVYETIRKDVSEISKIRMQQPGVREHLSNINNGHIVTEVTKRKISLSLTGRKQSLEEINKRIETNRTNSKLLGKTYEEIHGTEIANERKKNLSIKNTGKTQSPETKAKRSESLRGKVCSDETKKKISEATSGKVRSDETKKKISESHKGLVQSEVSNIKRSAALLGRPKSEETKQKMRKPKSEEHKRKISEAKQRRKLEKMLTEQDVD
jgi:hypothetical protein